MATFTIKVGDWDIAPPEKSFTAPKGGNNQLNVPAPGLLQDLNGADEAQLVEGAGPAHGTLVLNLDGSFSYTPDPDYVGTDSFAFKATNTSNNEESGPLIVEIEVPDYSTRGFIDEYEVQAGATLTDDDLGVLWNDQWANTAYVTSYPYNGSLNLNSDGSFEYVPNYGFTGTDTFKYFAVETGTWQQSSPTMVSIYVSPVVAADDVYLLSTAATSLNVSAPGVLANDSGADTVELVEDDGPYFGTLTLNPDGSLEYVPESGFIGTDYFTYRAFNSVSGDWSVPIGVEIVVGPRAVEDEYSVAANGSLNIASPGVLANDNQADGVYLAVDGEPQHGTLTLNADGSFTYVPDTGYSGDDYFVYVATDSATMTESPAGLVTIHVIQPVGTADSYIATEGQLLEQWAPGVLSNDQFADAAVLVGGSGPSHGTLNFSGDGSFTYTPTASYVGSDSFQYRAKDTLTGALSSPATVSFQVYNRPIATADSYAAASGIALASGSPGVLGNDQYANQVQLVAYPQHGSLTLNWWGSFTYTSTALYEGPDSFTYQAIHPVTGALSEPATVSIEVTYYPPAASDDEYWTPSDTPLYASTVSTGVLGNDQWVNRAQLQTGPNYGNLTLFNDGRFIYTPSGVTATDSFTYAAYHTTAGGWVTATAYIYVYSPLALDQAAAEGSSEPSLQVSELQAMSEVAIGYWLAAGVDDETLAARLAGLQFSIVDLPASHLGGSTGDGRIAIDVNAAGYGWFIDASALEHSEFANQTTPTEYRALNGSAAAGMADLLSVLIHEIGHELGLDHLEDSGDGNVMTGTIGLGTRRLPTAEDALLVDLLFQQGYSSRRRR